MIPLLLFVGVGWWLWPRFKPTVQPPKAACQVTRHDGPYEICLRRDGAGVWSWEASSKLPGQGPFSGSPFQSEEAALADAWVALAAYPIEAVIATSRDGLGLRLEPDGRVWATQEAAYLNAAAPIITTQSAAGDDAAGVVISILTKAFGVGWNPMRARIGGAGIHQAAQRYDARRQQPNATPQALARAIMGLPG
jgi:hypothetical protein